VILLKSGDRRCIFGFDDGVIADDIVARESAIDEVEAIRYANSVYEERYMISFSLT
jgi:hypothetical protein